MSVLLSRSVLLLNIAIILDCQLHFTYKWNIVCMPLALTLPSHSISMPWMDGNVIPSRRKELSRISAIKLWLAVADS